jgi:N-acyl-L-homoserine lactone synthetase
VFVIKRVETAEELELSQRLRYEVYCVEKQWLDPADFPEGRERDSYDEHASHFLALGIAGETVGTMRLITDGEHPLPVEEYFGIEIDRSLGNAELSRLVVGAPYRSSQHEIMLGICKAVYDEACTSNVDQLYSIMDRVLLRTLQMVGFPFTALGEPRFVWGDHTVPCVCPVGEVIPSLKRKHPKIGDFFEAPFEGFVDF